MMPCQDAWASTVIKAGSRLLVAIADGAGFAKLAEAASFKATAQALELMAAFSGPLEEVSEAHVMGWVEGVRNALAELAAENLCSIKECSSTILCAIVEGDEAYLWQIGDGSWVVETESGLEVATWPCSGEFINQTVFITSDDASEKWTHAYYEKVSRILGFTDGLEHLCLDFPNKAVYAPFVTKLFRALSQGSVQENVQEELARLLSSPIINERTDDDKTIVLIWRATEDVHVDGRDQLKN